MTRWTVVKTQFGGEIGPRSKVNRAADDIVMLSQQRVTNECEVRGFAGNVKFINERRPKTIKFCRSVSDTLGIWKKYVEWVRYVL